MGCRLAALFVYNSGLRYAWFGDYMKKYCLLFALIFALICCGCSVIDEIQDKKSGKASSSTPALIIGDAGTKRDSSSESAIVLGDESEGDEAQSSEANENDFHGYILSEEEKNNPRVKCMNTMVEGRVVMDFAGDINFDDGYSNMSKYRSGGSVMSAVMSSNLLEELNSADIFMVNNEFPYSNGGTPMPGKTFTFRAKPETVKNLHEMGVDIVSLANNHAYDYGESALLDTFDILESNNIPYVGAGRNIDEACKPFYFIAGGMKVAYVSATQIERTQTPDTKEATSDRAGVLRTLDPTRFLAVIEEAENNADITVVYVHWGSESTYDIDASQRELATKYANAGADLIIGDHSHCLQGFEYINGVPVIYSLGNFWFNSKSLDSCVVSVVASKGRIESVRFLPCLQQDCRTELLTRDSSEYSRILGVMTGLSFDVSIDEYGYVTPGTGHGVASVAPRPLKKAEYQMTDEEKNALLQQQLQNQ